MTSFGKYVVAKIHVFNALEMHVLCLFEQSIHLHNTRF